MSLARRSRSRRWPCQWRNERTMETHTMSPTSPVNRHRRSTKTPLVSSTILALPATSKMAETPSMPTRVVQCRTCHARIQCSLSLRHVGHLPNVSKSQIWSRLRGSAATVAQALTRFLRCPWRGRLDSRAGLLGSNTPKWRNSGVGFWVWLWVSFS